MANRHGYAQYRCLYDSHRLRLLDTMAPERIATGTGGIAGRLDGKAWQPLVHPTSCRDSGLCRWIWRASLQLPGGPGDHGASMICCARGHRSAPRGCATELGGATGLSDATGACPPAWAATGARFTAGGDERWRHPAHIRPAEEDWLRDALGLLQRRRFDPTRGDEILKVLRRRLMPLVGLGACAEGLQVGAHALSVVCAHPLPGAYPDGLHVSGTQKTLL